jgi:uncharacterized protein YabE (DUF348 family)
MRLIKRKSAWLAGVGLLVIGMAITVMLLHKTVTLCVDGESRRVSTFALTVGGLLRTEEVVLNPADTLSPGLNHWLRRGETVTVEHAVPVLVTADGKTHALFTVERYPLKLLGLAGITPLQSYDVALSNGLFIDLSDQLPRAAALNLQIRRAVTLTLVTESGEETLRSAAATVSEALWQSGITLHAADRLQPAPDTPLTEGLTVTLQQSREVTIRTAAGEIHTRTAAASVGEALAEAHLP